MDAADVETIRNILADYIDTDDPFYRPMINALEQRENIMVSDAARYLSLSLIRDISQHLTESSKSTKQLLTK